jgi:hypothetical protein
LLPVLQVNLINGGQGYLLAIVIRLVFSEANVDETDGLASAQRPLSYDVVVHAEKYLAAKFISLGEEETEMEPQQVKESAECYLTHVLLVWALPKQRVEDVFLLCQHEELLQFVFVLFVIL